MRARPFGLRAYGTATAFLGPAAHGILAWRTARGKEDGARLAERWGRPSAARPAGDLVWLHGASIGESALAWEAWRRLAPLLPNTRPLFTSGTQTSARWLAGRAPTALHQYLPLDSKRAARRFIAHWQPRLVLFFESEIWPNLIAAAKDSGAILALLNARMSTNSLAGWSKWPGTAKALFGSFDLIQPAEAAISDALKALGGQVSPAIGNLKISAAAPACDEAALARLRAAIGNRLVWLAASTHAGEDEIVIAAHALLRRQHPNALCMIAPRHPERGARVAELAGQAPRRSMGAAMEGPFYIVDTIGEMGLLYRACPITLIGGSLLPTGRGHNPFEALALGCATLTGPFVSSFEDVSSKLLPSGAMACVHDAQDLAQMVSSLWIDDAKRTGMAAQAHEALAGAEAVWQSTLHQLMALMKAARIDAST